MRPVQYAVWWEEEGKSLRPKFKKKKTLVEYYCVREKVRKYIVEIFL